MRKSPIAVLIPAYNAESTLQEAVDSVLNNTFEVDVFVVDDGSKLPVQSYLKPSGRLTILRQPNNVGLIKALNIGCQHIIDEGYPYLARMDADDICDPERFEKQIAFMKDNPRVGVLGTCGHVIEEHSKKTICYYNHPQYHADILKALNYNSCFIHPTLCIRTKLLKEHGLFSEDYPAAEDYEIIRRLSRHTQLANLSEYLIDYRISSNGISQSKRKQQLTTRFKIQLEYFNVKDPHAWFGACKTILLYAIPINLISVLKRKSRSFSRRR